MSLSLSLTLLLSAPAQAQFIGGTAPAGTGTLNFTVPGVAHAPGLATLFTCTNPNEISANIAVEVFNQNGSAQNASPALTMPPGGSVQFATTVTAPFSPDQYLSPVSPFTKGAAKIWSDVKKLQCGAILVNTQTTGWSPSSPRSKRATEAGFSPRRRGDAETRGRGEGNGQPGTGNRELRTGQLAGFLSTVFGFRSSISSGSCAGAAGWSTGFSRRQTSSQRRKTA